MASALSYAENIAPDNLRSPMLVPSSGVITKTTIPWVEKYRPVHFDDIVLDPMNRQLFTNILENGYFPNLMFYGPPGTGKTTTIINLINEYQYKYYGKSKGTVIHLNASDERGIDIIRNQINQFVKSKNLFEIGFKFVILDEVDYMTKTAQQALKTLLQTCTNNVRFCLICNYISKIDETLQHEFICIRFNQLPKKEIDKFIQNIAKSENLNIQPHVVDAIQNMYQSDIRSMINFLQLNQNLTEWANYIIHSGIWSKLHTMLLPDTSVASMRTPTQNLLCCPGVLEDDISSQYTQTIKTTENGTSVGVRLLSRDNLLSNNNNTTIKDIQKYIHQISIQYNMDKRQIIQSYFDYIIRMCSHILSTEFLNIMEDCLHNYDADIENLIAFFYYKLHNYYENM